MPDASQRLIAHLDMDAFYASVELLRYPDLRGRPVVIGGGRDQAPRVMADGTRRYASLRQYTGRGVITTATYEARALGAHSGMGVMKAAQLAPDAVLLPIDFDSLYEVHLFATIPTVAAAALLARLPGTRGRAAALAILAIAVAAEMQLVLVPPQEIFGEGGIARQGIVGRIGRSVGEQVGIVP